MNTISKILSFSFIILLASCGKVENVGESIAFRVDCGMPAVSGETKTIAETDGSNLSAFNVKLYCTSNTGLANGRSMADAGNGYWFPDGNRNWATWTNAQYTFIASAQPKNLATGTSLTVTSAQNITVKQPDTYGSASDFVDYLLSYQYVTPGSAQPVVRLQLVHSMAMVQVIVVKDKSIDDVRVTSISMNNFFNSGTGSCNGIVTYSEDATEPNGWNFTPTGNREHTYTLSSPFNTGSHTGGLAASDSEPATRYESAAIFTAMVIPQEVESKLTVDYYVNEKSRGVDNYVFHEDNQFSLKKDGLPQRWDSGHRYIYVITVDTGIHLDAQIVDWKHIDYIEGTVLPGI